MRILLNGETTEVSDQIRITDLLLQLKLKPELVVVELNLGVLKRDELAQRGLKEGDQVEIVHMVGGGAPGANLRDFRESGCL